MKRDYTLGLTILCFLFFPIVSAFPQPKANWESLFNGKELTWWKIVGSTGVAEVKDSAITCHMTANTTKHTFVCTNKKYGDFILEMDVNTDPEYNTGILLRCVDKPQNCDTCKISLYGYQVKIDPSTTRCWTGGVFDDYGASWHWLYDLSKDDRARKAYHIGDWNHFRIGLGKSTEGSELIVRSLIKLDLRPVYVVVNACSNTLAQVLIDYQASHSIAEINAVIKKLRVLDALT